MATIILKRKLPPLRHTPASRDPFYGHGYNPLWPSILSVAHDEENGGRVFIISDRPCALIDPPTGLPLSLAGLDVLEALEILPVKFRLWMSGPVPAGSLWTWGADGAGIVDPITNQPLNAAGGSCADMPGPYAPIPPAAVVSAYSGGTTAVLIFDRPVAATGSTPDDAITFNGMTAVFASKVDANTVSFGTPGPIAPGDPWVINRQPEWLSDPVLWPSSGTL